MFTLLDAGVCIVCVGLCVGPIYIFGAFICWRVLHYETVIGREYVRMRRIATFANIQTLITLYSEARAKYGNGDRDSSAHLITNTVRQIVMCAAPDISETSFRDLFMRFNPTIDKFAEGIADKKIQSVVNGARDAIAGILSS